MYQFHWTYLLFSTLPLPQWRACHPFLRMLYISIKKGQLFFILMNGVWMIIINQIFQTLKLTSSVTGVVEYRCYGCFVLMQSLGLHVYMQVHPYPIHYMCMDQQQTWWSYLYSFHVYIPTSATVMTYLRSQNVSFSLSYSNLSLIISLLFLQ